MTSASQTLAACRRREQDVFPRIPGMQELMMHYESSSDDLFRRYPDAAFAVMTSREILSGNREQNAICQQAYFDILQGKNIQEVRCRYEKAMTQYMKDHSWDD